MDLDSLGIIFVTDDFIYDAFDDGSGIASYMRFVSWSSILKRLFY